MSLGGGTAVAICLGHRRSIVLDWFSAASVGDPAALAQEIVAAGVPFETRSVAKEALHGSVGGIRTSIFHTRYPLLRPPIDWPEFGCRLASLADLAAMKLLAIAQRGARKDFLDVYALGVNGMPLNEMLSFYRAKYAPADIARVLYGLCYFIDAESEPMPELLVELDWDAVKTTIRQWVKQQPAE